MMIHVPTPNINNFLGDQPFPHLAGLIDPREAFEATKPSTMSSLWCHRKGLLADAVAPSGGFLDFCLHDTFVASILPVGSNS